MLKSSLPRGVFTFDDW